jgi:hypothetical protein
MFINRKIKHEKFNQILHTSFLTIQTNVTHKSMSRLFYITSISYSNNFLFIVSYLYNRQRHSMSVLIQWRTISCIRIHLSFNLDVYTLEQMVIIPSALTCKMYVHSRALRFLKLPGTDGSGSVSGSKNEKNRFHFRFLKIVLGTGGFMIINKITNNELFFG